MHSGNHSRPIEYAAFRAASAYAGSVVYGPGGTYGPRRQHDLQLVLVHTGAMEVTIDGVARLVPRLPLL